MDTGRNSVRHYWVPLRHFCLPFDRRMVFVVAGGGGEEGLVSLLEPRYMAG